MADNNNNPPIINSSNKPVFTIQIIRYYCTNCGEEKEEVRLCSTCSSSMRVVEVVEKYGDEAKEYLQQFSKKREVTLEGVSDTVEINEVDPLDEELEISENEATSFYNSSIFPDDDDKRDIKIKNGSGSLDDMLDILDRDEEEEDEDFTDMLLDGDGDNALPVL